MNLKVTAFACQPPKSRTLAKSNSWHDCGFMMPTLGYFAQLCAAMCSRFVWIPVRLAETLFGSSQRSRMVTCLELSRIEAGVKALAAFIRQHGGEPSAQVGIFARGNGSTALYLVVILVVFASLVAMRSWFNWFSTSRRDYHPESAIIGMSRDAAPSCLA